MMSNSLDSLGWDEGFKDQLAHVISLVMDLPTDCLFLHRIQDWSYSSNHKESIKIIVHGRQFDLKSSINIFTLPCFYTSATPTLVTVAPFAELANKHSGAISLRNVSLEDAHQRLVVLDHTDDPHGLLIVVQVFKQWRQYRFIVLQSHDIMD